MKIGTEVRVTLRTGLDLGSELQDERLLVCGILHYSEDDSVVLVCADTFEGMPISTHWLQKTGGYRIDQAMLYRERYLEKYGRYWLKDMW